MEGSGIVNKLKDMVGSDVKAYFLLYKYIPELLPKKNIKTFQELADTYACFKKGTTEESCNAWLVVDEKVQRAVKWILERLHQQKIIELYDKFYKQALEGDVRAFDSFIKFSNTYFTEEDKESEISKILKNVNLEEDDSDNEE